MTEPRTPRTDEHPMMIAYEPCPECNDPSLVRLPVDWQARVEAGNAIGIVGCGNPWHYVGIEAEARGAAVGSSERLAALRKRHRLSLNGCVGCDLPWHDHFDVTEDDFAPVAERLAEALDIFVISDPEGFSYSSEEAASAILAADPSLFALDPERRSDGEVHSFLTPDDPDDVCRGCGQTRSALDSHPDAERQRVYPYGAPTPGCDCRACATKDELSYVREAATPDAERQRAIGERWKDAAVPLLRMYRRDHDAMVKSSGSECRCDACDDARLFLARAAALPAAQEPDRRCGCRVDAELGAGAVCPACGHRDHGRSGCPERHKGD